MLDAEDSSGAVTLTEKIREVSSRACFDGHKQCSMFRVALHLHLSSDSEIMQNLLIGAFDFYAE